MSEHGALALFYSYPIAGQVSHATLDASRRRHVSRRCLVYGRYLRKRSTRSCVIELIFNRRGTAAPAFQRPAGHSRLYPLMRRTIVLVRTRAHRAPIFHKRAGEMLGVSPVHSAPFSQGLEEFPRDHRSARSRATCDARTHIRARAHTRARVLIGIGVVSVKYVSAARS